MSSNAMELPPPPSEKNTTSASDVLTNEDLLGKILLCLGCRSCLIGAALTSKHWLRAASRLFIHDFCLPHQPRLLGGYISHEGISGSEFIPLLQSEVLNHADFGFGNLPKPNVWDCQNGCVLFEFGGETLHHAGLAVRSPLLYPNMDRAMVLPSPPQPSCYSEYPHAMLLSADHGGDALCYRVSVRIRTWESNDKVMAFVSVLRSGSWFVDCIAIGSLGKSPIQMLPTTVLIDRKIYMATQAGFILGLELATQEFFTVDPPEGAEPDQYPGKLVHCRGDDSILYLFHVDGDKSLNVWLRRTNDDHGHRGAGTGGGANGWVLRDTISLRKTCGHFLEQVWETTADDQDEDIAAVTVVGTGDNAEFVFLELGITGVVVYVHLKTREVKQVYQREPDDDFLISVHPFMLIRPPVFPVQDAHEGEVIGHQE